MTVRRGKDAVALLSGQACVGEANIVCPSCASDRIQVFHVGTQVGANARDAPEGAPTSAHDQRRSVVEVVFSCERCPHHFALVIEEQQGNHLLVVHEEVPNFAD